jgi:hypothetical protein
MFNTRWFYMFNTNTIILHVQHKMVLHVQHKLDGGCVQVLVGVEMLDVCSNRLRYVHRGLLDLRVRVQL